MKLIKRLIVTSIGIINTMEHTNPSGNFTTRDHINISEYYEAEFWSKKFGVTVEQLKSTIRAVGNSVSAVEKSLKK